MTFVRPFTFLKFWSRDERSQEVVNTAWNHNIKPGMEAHKLLRTLNNTANALKI